MRDEVCWRKGEGCGVWITLEEKSWGSLGERNQLNS